MTPVTPTGPHRVDIPEDVLRAMDRTCPTTIVIDAAVGDVPQGLMRIWVDDEATGRYELAVAMDLDAPSPLADVLRNIADQVDRLESRRR